ncbi:MAG: aldo/keto reductase [Planctomycetaceae bacterium]|nr:aldo/keto reductase [Planctomycetaceae bacterium]
MQRQVLGSTEHEVSPISMGCVTFGREIDEAMSHQVLDRAWERGINFFDTAAAYADGESERVLGRWVAERGVRDQAVIATKFNGVLTKANLVHSAEQSLDRLGVDSIDLFYLHNWDNETPMEETLAGLHALLDSGKVKAIGCSNWQAWQLASSFLRCQAAGSQVLQCVQPPYNLVQREIEADLLPLCSDQGTGVVAYSPLAAGFLTGKYRRGQEVPAGTRFDVIPGHQPIYFTDHGYAIMERLDALSQRLGHTMVQLALAWTVAQPGITSVLIGARNTDQVDQAFEALVLAGQDGFLDAFSGF